MLRSLTQGSEIAAPPGVELNNVTVPGNDFSASDACNSVFSSFILGLCSAISSFLSLSVDSLIMRSIFLAVPHSLGLVHYLLC